MVILKLKTISLISKTKNQSLLGFGSLVYTTLL